MSARLNAALNWRPRTPFYYGWVILALTFLATFAATGVSQLVLGGIQVFITDDTGWKNSTISLAVTAGTWVAGLLYPFFGRLTDRYGARWLMPLGLIAAAVSFFSLAGVHAVWQFFAAYIFGRAVSNPTLLGVAPRAAVVNFFLRRRNIALALVSTFRPVSGAINIQIISLIAIRFGWRAAYRYLGVLSLILVAPIGLMMRHRPEDIGLLPDGARRQEPAPVSQGSLGQSSGRDAEFSWTLREALRTRAFWLVAITVSIGTLTAGTVGFSLVPYLVDDVGLSKGTAAGVLSLGTVLALGNLGWGMLADLITPRRCFVLSLVAAGGAVLYLTTVNSLVMALGFALLFGLTSDAEDLLYSMMLAEYFGRNSYGTILGVVAPFQMLTLGLGPALGAVYRETVGNYNGLYVALAISYFVAAVLIFLVKRPALPARASAVRSAQTK